MHPILVKTLGGLSGAYYFRQFIFGLIFPAIMVFVFTHATKPQPLTTELIFTMIVNTLLYPYSRFVYEGVMGFLLGETVFVANGFIVLFLKFVTMAVCWSMAVLIAPIGLAYLYYYHSRRL